MSSNKLNIINPLELEGWDDLISGHQDATIFHTSSWAKVIAESYGYRPLYFTKIEAGELEALVPLMEVKKDDSFSGVREFYRLNSLTRREHGLPPQPFNFFRNLHKHIIAKGFGTVFLGSCQGENVAAIVCLNLGRKVVYKYGASARKFQATRANNLSCGRARAIKHYGNAGCETFCFGRTALENMGLIQLKAGWGTREDIIQYVRCDLHNNNFVTESDKTSGWHNKIFSRMPVPALNLLGNVLYRHREGCGNQPLS